MLPSPKLSSVDWLLDESHDLSNEHRPSELTASQPVQGIPQIGRSDVDDILSQPFRCVAVVARGPRRSPLGGGQPACDGNYLGQHRWSCGGGCLWLS